MKKIIYVSDPIILFSAPMEFVGYICKLARSKVTAIVLEQNSAVSTGDCYKKNSHRLKNIFGSMGIQCAVQVDGGDPLMEILLESRYADLILLDPATAFSAIHVTIPTGLVEETLFATECPIVLMPANFTGIEQLVFAYDGRADSMYAIKQFTYLFPELRDTRIVVVSINAGKIDTEERYKFREWLHSNYGNIEYYFVDGDSRATLTEALLQRQKAFFIMGAYGRNKFSSFFSSSHATNFLKLTSQPVFIAHS